ncbi:MAG: efflux RND transporter periplasmic adaptor subunit [Betaproteobacteria bacterium]|jgi:RND family efflux transporter MFP subunit|nr:efflux RND transporter periplasmic adaptor subunit [Betaproteobacteria bacterium]NDB43288.1 efflux RND transporter periplasmic adaptor subunit [Betaproteobacteria bacterium]
MTFLSKRALIATVLLLVLGASLGYFRGWFDNKQVNTKAPQSNGPVNIELAPTDIVIAQKISMTQGLPISGTLKATRSAMVKARVAGELQALEVREGDAVAAGQVLARVDTTEYLARQRQAQQQAEAARAQVEVAQRQFDNNNALVNQGFISKTALDTSIANLNGAKATYQAALSALDVATKAVDDCVMKAPLSGLISQRLAQPGERVSPEARIVEIVDLTQLELEAPLSSTDALNVKVGQTAKLFIENSKASVVAKVLRINPSTQAGSRSVLVYLGLSAHPLLRQGLFVQGSLGTQTIQAVVVPLESVRNDKTEPYVQTLQNGQVVHVKVATGLKGEVDGKAVMALSELSEGTQVLAPSAGAVRDGTWVTRNNSKP